MMTQAALPFPCVSTDEAMEPRAAAGDSFRSSSSSSTLFSEDSFHVGYYPPMSEYEEIPSLRWLPENFLSSKPNNPPPSPGRAAAAVTTRVINKKKDHLHGPAEWKRKEQTQLPHFIRPLSSKKSPKMSSILGRAGMMAVELLDSLGSSMSNLKTGNGFSSGMVYLRNRNKVSILAFEVGNTISKGATLMHSLSEENVQFLKKEVLPSDGVQQLVSADMKDLLGIVTADKREEFNVFSKEVVRFGNLGRDPQWHNLARFFKNLGAGLTSQQLLKKEAKRAMQQLMDLTHYTSELYHEIHALDRFEQYYRWKLREEESLPSSQGENLMILHSELKVQRKHVKSLKKKSLWRRNLEEVVEKLVLVATFLHEEIFRAFDQTDTVAANYNPDHVVPRFGSSGPAVGGTDAMNGNPRHAVSRLGSSGLALQYANIINQIDNIVSRPMSLPANTRDTLYHGLPVEVKAALRSRLQSFHVKEELTIAQIEAEIQKTLQWLVPMADSTIKAHQGFGWVGEWANMGTELNKKPVQQYTVIRIQTLYHADRKRTDEYILELVVWLHHLVSPRKSRGLGFKSFKSEQYPCQKDEFSSHVKKQSLSLSANDKPHHFTTLRGGQRDVEMYQLQENGSRKKQGFVTKEEEKVRMWWDRNRSSGSSPTREFSAGLDFQFGRRKVLDVIDGLDIPWFAESGRFSPILHDSHPIPMGIGPIPPNRGESEKI